MEPVHAVGNADQYPRKSFSRSSSSSSSSSEDFFQIDPKELAKATNKGGTGAGDGTTPRTPIGTPFSDEAPPFSSTPGSPEVEKAVHHGLPPKYGGGPPSGEFLRAAGAQSDNPFTAADSNYAQSPPSLQVMAGKNEIPDPYRIPSTVFARTKSTTPMEWSVASNESLFSIHVGNNSFSRDHALLNGRSGELGNYPSPSEPFPPPPTGAAGAAPPQETPPPPHPPHPSHHNSWDHHQRGSSSGNTSPDQMTEAANAQAMKDVLRAAADEHVTGAASPAAVGTGGNNSPTISRHSDGSGASIHSFAFPILTGEGGRTVSVKVTDSEHTPQHQQSQKQKQQTENVGHHQSSADPASVAPNTAQTRWFPCFACCPYCC